MSPHSGWEEDDLGRLGSSVPHLWVRLLGVGEKRQVRARNPEEGNFQKLGIIKVSSIGTQKDTP